MEPEATQIEALPLARDVAQLLMEQLAPEERMVWAGRPRAGAYLGHDWPGVGLAGGFLVPLAVLAMIIGADLTAGGLVWGGMVAGAVGVVLLLLFTMLCLGICRRARHTGYAITDLRAVVVRTWPGRKVFSFPPEMLQGLSVRVGRKGRGTILLRVVARNGGLFWVYQRGFVGIDDVAKVAGRLRALAATASLERLSAYAQERLQPWMDRMALPGAILFALMAVHAALEHGFPAAWEEMEFVFGIMYAPMCLLRFVQSLEWTRAYERRPGPLTTFESIVLLREPELQARVAWPLLAGLVAVAVVLTARALRSGALDIGQSWVLIAAGVVFCLLFLQSVKRWLVGKGPQRPPEDLLR